jgi:ABC-type polysaccharide/polyol phosphate transport system ATPase subunit
MMDAVISIDHVSKRFKLYENMIMDPIKEYLFFWKRRNFYKEFWAVKDVSFEVERGGIIGIIGANGAGKTTLLKLIAGLLETDKGHIRVHGKVTALLTLGLGFHHEFTGRENILYGGMLLGMSKKEVLRKMPDIIEFAEIGDYIDRPLRTYSSGMRARLIFATSMSIDPDILLVDEALATGDSYFVQKCSKRIETICKSGATILYVSHNLWHIQQICHRAILMDKGKIVADGDPTSVISNYHALTFEKEKNHPLIFENQALKRIGGTGEVTVTDIKIKDAQGQETTGFHTGDRMNIELYYESFNPDIHEINIFVGFLSCRDFSYVSEINTIEYIEQNSSKTRSNAIKIEKRGVISIRVESLLLLNNHYSLWVILYAKELGHLYYSEYKNVRPFFVAKSSNPSLKGDAVCWLPATFEVCGDIQSTEFEKGGRNG